MYNDSATIMMLNTLTPTHPGSGTELSYVDMPIQREGHTGFPKIEAATLKGCIRHDVIQRKNVGADLIDRIFGKQDNGDFASAMSITDARLLFFPVKSACGVFGWVTCPMVLERFFKEYRLVFGQDFAGAWDVEQGICSKGSELSQEKGSPCTIMLEDYTYSVKESSQFTEFLTQLIGRLPEDSITGDLILKRAVVIDDNDFAGFVKYSTEVNTRIKIQASTGTVAGGALFTEEYLPPECVLYSLIYFTDTHCAQDEEKSASGMDREQVKAVFTELVSGKMIQVGANSTLGKGLMQVKIWEER